MIVGHQKQWDFLKKAAGTKKSSHAYLFSGQEKLGKKTMALEWASFVLDSSLEKLNNHPDLIFIEAEKKEIQISQIRKLIWRLSLKPSLAKIKVAIIDDAHMMNEAAQTCLLKTLEEPRGEALLILISDKGRYLLPTILSRLQIIKFNFVEEKEIKKLLESRGLLAKEIKRISEIALGRPGMALDLASDMEKLESFDQRIADLKKIPDSSFCFRFQYVKNLTEDPEKTKEALDIWLVHLRAVLLSRFSFLTQDLPQGEDKFKNYPTEKIKNIIKDIQKIKLLLSKTNVNSKLALETLMLEF